MAWSKYQNAIFEYATDPNGGSFAVSAVAGSGKTVTAIECAKRISAQNPSANILFLAFNNTIVDKLKEETRGMTNIRCSTLHSLGYGIIGKSNLKLHLNEDKWKDYFHKLAPKVMSADVPANKKFLFERNCLSLFDMCRINLIKSGDMDGLSYIASKFGIDVIANEFEVVNRALKKKGDLIGFRTKDGFDIDYVDMITIPLTDAFRKFIFKYDVVFIDEAQDLNKAQQELMMNCVKKHGKFICIGDPRQAINGFSGSLDDSFYILAAQAGKTLPLSVNYRCGRNIVAEAQKIVKEIEPWEEAIDGTITHTETLKDVKIGDMVICRKTAPLIAVALKMMSIGKSCYIKGRDVADGLRELIYDALAKDNGIGLGLFYAKLENRAENIREDLISRGMSLHNPQYTEMVDKVESIKVLGSHCECVNDILVLLDKIFIDTVMNNAVMMSTVHKAKGLENDRVFIICPELLPLRYKDQQEWELRQEINLKYVAVTRAKSELVYVDVCEAMIKDIEV